MLEIRGASPGLLDDPLLLDVGGAAPRAALTWRARLRDDDGFVWRATADTPQGLLDAWAPAKATAGAVAALRSLRPVDVDVRVGDPDGASSSRTVTRTLLADGVKVRRWRDGVAGSLFLPGHAAASALVVDAHDADGAAAVPPAAALLASRGVLVFVVTGGKGDPVAAARELAAALPAAPATIRERTAGNLPPAPGLPRRSDPPADPAAWDALLAELGATPRRVAR